MYLYTYLFLRPIRMLLYSQATCINHLRIGVAVCFYTQAMAGSGGLRVTFNSTLQGRFEIVENSNLCFNGSDGELGEGRVRLLKV